MPTLTRSRPKDLVTMQMLLDHMPALEERTLRHWMSKNPDDFRKRCMVTIVRKTFFDLPAIEAWLEEHRGVKAR